jgi:hypothetical protein
LHINHSQQLKKKKATLFGSTIITFFGSTHFYKHGNEAQQEFLEDLALTSTKDTRFCQHVKTSSNGR